VVANGAVVVDLGEAEVFVGQVTQVRQRRLNADRPTSDLLQEQPQLLVNALSLRVSGRIIASRLAKTFVSLCYTLAVGGGEPAAVRRLRAAVDN
jgi:hypothetical protein